MQKELFQVPPQYMRPFPIHNFNPNIIITEGINNQNF